MLNSNLVNLDDIFVSTIFMAILKFRKYRFFAIKLSASFRKLRVQLNSNIFSR